MVVYKAEHNVVVYKAECSVAVYKAEHILVVYIAEHIVVVYLAECSVVVYKVEQYGCYIQWLKLNTNLNAIKLDKKWNSNFGILHILAPFGCVLER